MVGVTVDLVQVRQIANTMRGRADFDDLMSDGALGLTQALARFEEGHGATFRTYAGHRIVGAMRDGIRARGRTRSAAPRPKPSAFTRDYSGLSNAEPSILSRLEKADQEGSLRAALARVTGRRAEVLRLYFFEDFTLQKIADRFGVSEGTISLVKRDALNQLRELYQSQ